MKSARLFLALAVLLLGAELAHATTVTFTIQTQNVLRFGHGKRLATQCAALDVVAAEVDVVVMQEVMKPDYPCLKGVNDKDVDLKLPPNFQYATSDAKGKTSYIEYYGILHRTGNGANSFSKPTIADLGVFDDDYARPPFAALFKVTGNDAKSCNVWIVDFHAVFGNTIGLRRAEARAMERVYQHLRALKTGAVLIVGDWNLDADDDAFGWVKTNANQGSIDPDVQTSLTRAGTPSSAYDHAVWHTVPIVVKKILPLANPTTWTYNGGNSATWRDTVSDHLGVRLSVTVTC